MPFDLDRRLVGGSRLRCVGDARQLPEDEGADHREDHDRHDRPEHLEPRRAVDLRAVGGACALAAAVLDDEGDQRALDDQEDHAGEDRDEDEGAVDAVRVRRMGLAGQEAAVAGVRDSRRREGDQGRTKSGKGGPAHADWHRIERGSAEPCRAAPGGRRRLRGVRQRGAAAARRRFRPGRAGARLPARSWRPRAGSGSGAGRASSSASRAPIGETTRSTSSTLDDGRRTVLSLRPTLPA